LGYLQLLRGVTYRELAEQNRLRLIPETAPRGLIFDRAGEELATNRVAFEVAVVPQHLTMDASPGMRRLGGKGQRPGSPEALRAVLASLSPLVERSVEELEARFHQSYSRPFLPVTLVSPLSKATVLRIEEERLRLPGVFVESVMTRHYPLGSTASHLLGYLGKSPPETFYVLKQYGVQPHDLVGRAGLEGVFDDVLRGQSGGSLVEVDHRGRQIRILGYRQPSPGEPAVLTIDARLQALIEQYFAGQPGACVVLDPNTGELLAMVSVPSFNPAVFAKKDQQAIRALLADVNGRPLLNRATSGLYTPGSTVKLLTALTALEEGVITSETAITCPGFLTIGDRRFHCWNRDGHGSLRLREALRSSCNVYFMQVGRRLGLQKLRHGFAKAGFGRRTGWLLEEQPGTLPGGRRFSEGEVALLAMGQGEILITPLQAAVMASAIANQGWLVKPWVVKTISGRPVDPPHPVHLDWLARHLATVREGMVAVVNDLEGTGILAHSDRVQVAGKTGSAQTHIPGRTHGWFVGFCPADEPLAAMAIVAEYGGAGGELPASMARAICEYLISSRQSLQASCEPSSLSGAQGADRIAKRI